MGLSLLQRRDPRSLPLDQRYAVGGPVSPGYLLGAAALILLHLALLGFGGMTAIDQARKLAVYVPVPATVIASSLRVWTTQGRHGTRYHYHPDVRYRYQVDGQRYSSIEVDAISHSYGYAEAQDILARYRAGAQVTAYRDPDHASQAFLNHACHSDPYLLINISTLIAVIASFALLKGWPAPDASARSRRLGLGAAYAIAIPVLAELHYRINGGILTGPMVLSELIGVAICIYPVWAWLKLRASAPAGLEDARALAAMEERRPPPE